MYVKIVQRYDKFCFNLPENQNYDRKKTERAINRKRAGCLNNICTQIDKYSLLVTRHSLLFNQLHQICILKAVGSFKP